MDDNDDTELIVDDPTPVPRSDVVADPTEFADPAGARELGDTDELGDAGELEDAEEVPRVRRPPRKRSSRSPWVTRTVILGLIVAGTLVISTVSNASPIAAFFALLLGVVIFRTGYFFLQQFATPPPPPPDPGTLRKVRLVYRCPVCGTEVRMTAANNEDPEPPRHCMDDMELVTPIE